MGEDPGVLCSGVTADAGAEEGSRNPREEQGGTIAKDESRFNTAFVFHDERTVRFEVVAIGCGLLAYHRSLLP